jgi:hypothetical protein
LKVSSRPIFVESGLVQFRMKTRRSREQVSACYPRSALTLRVRTSLTRNRWSTGTFHVEILAGDRDNVIRAVGLDDKVAAFTFYWAALMTWNQSKKEVDGTGSSPSYGRSNARPKVGLDRQARQSFKHAVINPQRLLAGRWHQSERQSAAKLLTYLGSRCYLMVS